MWAKIKCRISEFPVIFFRMVTPPQDHHTLMYNTTHTGKINLLYLSNQMTIKPRLSSKRVLSQFQGSRKNKRTRIKNPDSVDMEDLENLILPKNNRRQSKLTRVLYVYFCMQLAEKCWDNKRNVGQTRDNLWRNHQSQEVKNRCSCE